MFVTLSRRNTSLINQQLGLIEQLRPEELKKHLATMHDQANRMQRLVDDLLTLARADAGRQLQVAPVALAPLLDDLARQARLLAPERAMLLTPLPLRRLLPAVTLIAALVAAYAGSLGGTSEASDASSAGKTGRTGAACDAGTSV